MFQNYKINIKKLIKILFLMQKEMCIYAGKIILLDLQNTKFLIEK